MELSRRQFLILSALSAGGLLFMRGDSQPHIAEPVSEYSDLLRSYILLRYGIETPQSIDERFTEQIIETVNGQEHTKKQQNTLFTKEESEEVISLFDDMPKASAFTRLIIPYRDERNTIAGGWYGGFDWPLRLNKKLLEYGLPKDKFLSEKPAIGLLLPEYQSLSDPIPKETINGAVSIALRMSRIVPREATLSTDYNLETPTHKDRLRHTLIHETWGHGFWETVGLASSKTIDAYRQRKETSEYGMNRWDINHPLMRSFSVVNHWKLVPYQKYLDQFGIYARTSVLKSHPEHSDRLIWERNYDIWGSPYRRKTRLTLYGDYGPPHEAFAEYFTAFKTASDILTPEEQRYFGRIYSGLYRDPYRFIRNIVKNPGMLLDDPNDLPAVQYEKIT